MTIKQLGIMSVLNLNVMNVDNKRLKTNICKGIQLLYIRMQKYKSSSTNIIYIRSLSSMEFSMQNHFILVCESFATKLASIRAAVCVETANVNVNVNVTKQYENTQSIRAPQSWTLMREMWLWSVWIHLTWSAINIKCISVRVLLCSSILPFWLNDLEQKSQPVCFLQIYHTNQEVSMMYIVTVGTWITTMWLQLQIVWSFQVLRRFAVFVTWWSVWSASVLFLSVRAAVTTFL